jgi:hypothetical protein
MLSARIALGGSRWILRPPPQPSAQILRAVRLQSTGAEKQASLRRPRNRTGKSGTTTTAIKQQESSSSSSNVNNSNTFGISNDVAIIGAGLVVVGILVKFWVYRREQIDQEEAGKQSLYLYRTKETRRPDWKEACDKIGFPFCNYPGVRSNVWFGETEPYWNEGASYHVHPYGRWMLEKATFEIHSMCLEAADEVIASDSLLEKFEIPRDLCQAVRHSWKTWQPDIAGRLDLLWDGTHPPKLAEYNADTPTVLIKSAIAQEDWFRHVYGEKGEGKKNNDGKFSQFNVIASAMEEGFRRMKRKNPDSTLLLTTNRPSAERAFLEERSTVKFMQERAIQAGLPTQ